MKTRIMIDIETLSLEPSAHILSIGATTLDLGNLFYATVSDEQGRTVSVDTVRWWMNQTESAVGSAFFGDFSVKLESALKGLHEFITGNRLIPQRGETASIEVWSKHPALDISVLEHAFRQHGINTPWKYHEVMDYATALNMWREKFDMGPKDHPDIKGEYIAHNALGDAKRQAEELNVVLHDLGLV
jgi:DNA polymerase III epsilon subunit-like protein